MTEKPKAIDLFCGCGGLTLGLKQAGFNVIGAIDIDKLSIETYKANHQEVHLWENDIRDLTSEEIKKTLNLKKGDLDLLAGCPPCQGFSKMRTLNGKRKIKDSQNRLIDEFLRIAIELLPKAIMMENVPRLKHYYRFQNFCRQLKKFGYTLKYDVLNAADYGVPQRRRRLILIASRIGEIDFAEKTKKRTVADTIKNLSKTGQSGDPLHDYKQNRTQKVQDIINIIPKDGGSRNDLGEKYKLNCHKRCNGFKDVYGRMSWTNQAPTITGGCINPSKGRFLHPEENRAITLREAALLQSFPINYMFEIRNRESVALMIGNALPPEFIKCHSLIIRKHLQRNLETT